MARILIAEHNQTTADFLAKELQKGGHQVEQVDNCLDTWRLSGREIYDILLIDVVMPGIDGFVLAQKALQENPLLQVIFITGFAGVAMDTISTPNYAPAPITTRPFHLKEINARVRYLLGQGYMPMRAQSGGHPTQGTPASSNTNTVIYADFARKQTQQAGQ